MLGGVLAVELRFRRVNGENLRTKRPVPGVCPSLPGYGFSDKPAAPGWGIERISDAWCELMARLGYRRFGAQGSDWGTSIATMHRSTATRSGRRHPSHAAARTARSGHVGRPHRCRAGGARDTAGGGRMGLRILGAAVDPNSCILVGRAAGRPFKFHVVGMGAGQGFSPKKLDPVSSGSERRPHSA